MKGYVLSLCDYTGNMVAPWLENGFECWTVDLQHEPGVRRDGLRVHVGADIRNWTPPDLPWKIIFAFPPCTHLAVSGARWMKKKGLRALAEALDVFGACLDICEGQPAPWMVENPVSTVSTYYRKPDHTFDPCDYGDPYTKKTCLWAGNGFKMPTKHRVLPTLGSLMHKIPPHWNRANLRSATPQGFARSVLWANF